MKQLYFECFSGISGDMTLAALTDLCVPAEYLSAELEKLGIDGYTVTFERTVKNGIGANRAIVQIEEEHTHRTYADIVKIIESSEITDGAKEIAKSIFRIIAEAEGKVHGVSADNVHFHEVGALDSIVDIVGTAICIDYIKPDRIISSPVNDGRGFIKCRHGIIPVPVPAVVEIFASKGVLSKVLDIDKELVTPTGAGIVAALAEEFTLPKDSVVRKTGYGAGFYDLDIPNVLRVSLLESGESGDETVTVIETNIDDQTPESIAFAMEKLMDAGAKDVFFTPIQMKKNRPAVLLTVLCGSSDADKMSGLIFENTSTLGVRIREEKRICLKREKGLVKTPYGDIEVKTCWHGNGKRTAPEYGSAKEAALRSGVPLDEIYKSVYKCLDN